MTDNKFGKHLKFKGLVLLIVIFSLQFVATNAIGQVVMPRIFSDNMVIQRDNKITIWGWASPRERISVALAGQTARARADRNGNWSVEIGPFEAGGPFQMVVRGNNTLTFSNILFGEVWLASGQSNMEWSVARSANPEEEIKNANYPEIRLFTVPRHMSGEPEMDFEEGEWLVCNPENIADFSAVAYYFGRHLHHELNVPIGLINSTWGGTIAETWMSYEAMVELDDFRERMLTTQLSDLDNITREAEKKAELWMEKIDSDDQGMINRWYLAESDDSDWNEMRLPVLWEQAGLPDLDGVVWFRKEIILTENQTKAPFILNLGPVDDSDYTYINGQLVGKTIDRFSANRRYEVPADMLKEGKNIISVRVIDTGGGGGIWGDEADLYYSIGGQRFSLAGNWRYAVGIDLPRPAVAASGPNMHPTLLFNGMINAITDYRIRGVIWYQGESNAGRAWQYRTVFKALINDWRKQWEDPEMPFLFVQLANFMKADSYPVESQWAELREAQKMALSLPNTGMAVAIDIGDPDDIHPLNKQDVGLRLALNALHIAYGKDVVFSGPVFSSQQIDGDKIRLRFSSIGSGLMVDDKYGYLKGFAIAGEDRVFHWARAFLDGDQVVVYSDNVSDPVAVRYAWGNNPEDANLFNKERLPASPFRTDNWPEITRSNR